MADTLRQTTIPAHTDTFRQFKSDLLTWQSCARTVEDVKVPTENAKHAHSNSSLFWRGGPSFCGPQRSSAPPSSPGYILRYKLFVKLLTKSVLFQEKVLELSLFLMAVFSCLILDSAGYTRSACFAVCFPRLSSSCLLLSILILHFLALTNTLTRSTHLTLIYSWQTKWFLN